MICWGSWANTQKLATKSWSFQLFYWDYALGTFLLALIMALTFGNFGQHGRSFLPDLLQASQASFIYALIGGFVFNLANILLVAAIDIAGMAVAFPVGIGIALVLGVIVNYLKVPLGNPLILFLGVAAIAVAIILDAIAYKQLSRKQTQQHMVKGLIIAIVAGILMGFFYRFVADSMSMNLVNPAAGKFTPYTATVIFTLGIVISSFIWNSYVMKKPFVGSPVAFIDYIKKGTTKLHLVGLLGGAIWGLGSLLNFIAAGRAGFAISYGLGQGATMIAALWGVFIWREFKHAAKTTYLLLTLMFILYIIGLCLIIAARIY
jgi:glucose uptake protein